jgi:hypothetical protein
MACKIYIALKASEACNQINLNYNNERSVPAYRPRAHWGRLEKTSKQDGLSATMPFVLVQHGLLETAPDGTD